MSPRRVHLIGIGGIGLSAIARILIARGDQVSGSDLQSSAITDDLARRGARIFVGQKAENVRGVDLVLATSAAPPTNPEVLEAERLGIRIVKRYDFFPELTAGKSTIAIAGTHGKTTTTGMIGTILVDAGLDPDVVVGGIIPELEGNGRAGQGKYFVVEADEYDRAFLGLRPTVAVVTSIEMDHPDIYLDLDAVAQAFGEFMALVPPEGLVVGCGDGEQVERELKEVKKAPVIRYGFQSSNDWRATDVCLAENGGSTFRAWRGGQAIGAFELQIPGRHNVSNALAALAVADRLGIPADRVRASLSRFRGAGRRFEVQGDARGVTIVDDYAHHPTEIRATLAAARARYPGRPLWAIFQPHTYSRTKALLDDFAQALGDADHVLVTEIFAARERNGRGISGEQIVERMRHRDARFVPTLDGCADYLAPRLKSGDVLVTLGAGDVYRVGRMVASRRGA